MFYSPLRYPGGKNKLSKFISEICISNNINGHYIEPFAGGAAVALYLLLENKVSSVTINDKDRSIYAFWYALINYTNEFCDLIIKTQVNIENWHKAKKIQKSKDKASLLQLGFSTFFLNRTNISGIINGGVIGGLDQKGKYKIDCRFNKPELIKRILNISRYKKNIRLYCLDAVDLIKKIESEAKLDKYIFYFDPPYYLKGQSLYMNHLKHTDHERISKMIKKIKNIHWIVSYDNVPKIKEMYKQYRTLEYTLNYTARYLRKGTEILIFSNKLNLPAMEIAC
jgi:DNA adenine methylase